MRSRPRLFEGRGQIGSQSFELALDPAGAADHHVIRSIMAARRNDLAGELAEAALHAIADNRAADLLADGEADTLGWVAILAIADEEDKARRRRAPSGVRSEKIRAFPKNG